MKRRAKVIVNPAAGRGIPLKSLPTIEELLNKEDLSYDIIVTKCPGHAIELAEQAVSEGFNEVVAVGGDGTVNEVINGLMKSSDKGAEKCVLGVIGAGSGNDFLFGMGLPLDLEENCRIVAEGKSRLIDIGRVYLDDAKECRYFGNGIGIGFDAVVGFEAKKLKHIRGPLSYLIGAIKTIFLYDNAPEVKISCNGREYQQRSLMVSIMNGIRMGGGFMMTPNSQSDDGQLDLCIAGHAGVLRLFQLMFHFMKGTQEGDKEITFDRTDRLRVEAVHKGLPAHLDGETLCLEGRQFEIDVLAKRLKLLC